MPTFNPAIGLKNIYYWWHYLYIYFFFNEWTDCFSTIVANSILFDEMKQQNTPMSHRHLNGSQYSCTDKHKLLHVHVCMVVVVLHINVASTGLTRAPFCIPGRMKINAFYCCTLKACVGWGCKKVRRERRESIWWKQRTALVTAEHILQEITFISTNRTLLTILQAKWKGPKHCRWFVSHL